jgi:hypothetical protein
MARDRAGIEASEPAVGICVAQCRTIVPTSSAKTAISLARKS